MREYPLQILEVRAAAPERPVTVTAAVTAEAEPLVTITAAVTAEASQAILIALSEQLDRRRRQPTESVEDVLALREQISLVEQFAPLAAAGAHAILQFGETDLRACLVNLTAYAQRVDGEHFQPVELRERLHLIAEITPILWDANATAAAAGGEPLTPAAQ